MKKCCFIVPYFGKLPSVFPLWLQCCRHNQDFNWLIFTDDITEYHYPDNVQVKYISFSELKNRIEEKMGFPVSLYKAYKLCDFRPCYGDIFEEELRGFAHWGYCDLDLVFGSLKEFFTDEILTEYDKVSVLGHMSVYKNIRPINLSYKLCNYKSIFEDSRNRIFDEIRYPLNINSILEKNGAKVLKTIPYVDIGEEHFNFHLYEYREGRRTTKLPYEPVVIQYENGKLYKCTLSNETVFRDEVAYAHFQKRCLTLNKDCCADSYIIVPNKVMSNIELTKELIYTYRKENLLYFINKRLERIKRAVISRLS